MGHLRIISPAPVYSNVSTIADYYERSETPEKIQQQSFILKGVTVPRSFRRLAVGVFRLLRIELDTFRCSEEQNEFIETDYTATTMSLFDLFEMSYV